MKFDSIRIARIGKWDENFIPIKCIVNGVKMMSSVIVRSHSCGGVVL